MQPSNALEPGPIRALHLRWGLVIPMILRTELNERGRQYG